MFWDLHVHIREEISSQKRYQVMFFGCSDVSYSFFMCSHQQLRHHLDILIYFTPINADTLLLFRACSLTKTITADKTSCDSNDCMMFQP